MVREDLKTQKGISMSEEIKNPEGGQPEEETAEQKLERLTSDYGKLKKAFDKTASEAADYKKKYMATLSEKEQAEQERADAQASLQQKYDELLRQNTLTTYERNFIELGYDSKQAKEAAIAQADGDIETLFKIQKSAQDSLVKSKQAEWLKGRPQPSAGGGDDSITKEKFDSMSLAEKTKLFRENRAEYDRLIKL